MAHKIFRRSIFLIALTLILTMGALVVPHIAQAQTDVESNCVLTPDLVNGQGFNLDGLGFNLDGLGFNLDGLGFNLDGLGLDPSAIVQEIRDNPAETSWLVEFARPINGAVDYNTQAVAVIIVDNDAHGDRVAAVYNASNALLEAELGTSMIELHHVDIGDAGYNADVVANRLRDKVAELEATGIQRFVVNLSIGLIPCADDIIVGDTTIDFDLEQALDVIEIANEFYPVNHILECVSQLDDETYMAHFGFETPNGVPVYIPHNLEDTEDTSERETNFLSGGGLTDGEAKAATPTYFSRPRMVEGRPGRSTFYPNSAFQVLFDGSDLVWTLQGRTETANAESRPCDPEPTMLDSFTAQIADADAPVVGRLECVADNGDGTFTAHFGYNNNTLVEEALVPIFVPTSANNSLSGGGLTAAEASAATPKYFGVPDITPEDMGRSADFPNSAFQVVFNSEAALEWNLYGQVITARTDSNRCATPSSYGLQDYIAEQFGVADADVADVMVDLFSESERTDDTLQELRVLLQEYLSRSATEETFRLVPVASSGNFRPWFEEATGSSEVLPLAPARWSETVAVGATLGNPADLWQFSHDSNVAVVGGAYSVETDTLVMGTSFAAPTVSRIYAGYLTMADSCNFLQDNGTVFPPILEPNLFNNSTLTPDATSPFDCNVPPVQPTCDGLTASIFVDPTTNLIVGGPDDGQTYNGELRGTNEADVIIGTDSDDRMVGLGGDDVLCGLAGSDNIIGGNGDDRLFGGMGDDILRGENGRDTLFGRAGDDDLSGGTNDDIVRGGDGVDTVRGDDGNDTLMGGPGNDTLSGSNGFDTIYGGSIDQASINTGNDTIDGGNGDDTVFGGDGDDNITGGEGADRLHGGASASDNDLSGNDVIVGEGGMDTIFGGDGDDDLSGGNAQDTIFGGDGNDTVVGDGGDDTLNGGNGMDVMRGDDGQDILNGGAGADNLSGGNGDDIMSGGADNDQLFGDGGNDRLFGGAENNHINTGDDTLDGGNGDDRLFGGDGNDTLSGGNNNDIIYGGSTDAADDVSGTDDLSGGNGDDQLYGGDGSDTLSGGDNNDRLFGGDGVDTISGGRGDDRIFGGNDGDVIEGGLNNDVISGEAGDDLLYGDAGNDTIYSGSAANRDTNTGDDIIRGGDGNDTAFPGDGDDSITQVENINR